MSSPVPPKLMLQSVDKDDEDGDGHYNQHSWGAVGMEDVFALIHLDKACICFIDLTL